MKIIFVTSLKFWLKIYEFACIIFIEIWYLNKYIDIALLINNFKKLYLAIKKREKEREFHFVKRWKEYSLPI